MAYLLIASPISLRFKDYCSQQDPFLTAKKCFQNGTSLASPRNHLSFYMCFQQNTKIVQIWYGLILKDEGLTAKHFKFKIQGCILGQIWQRLQLWWYKSGVQTDEVERFWKWSEMFHLTFCSCWKRV